jgi:hypothetical protein
MTRVTRERCASLCCDRAGGLPLLLRVLLFCLYGWTSSERGRSLPAAERPCGAAGGARLCIAMHAARPSQLLAPRPRPRDAKGCCACCCLVVASCPVAPWPPWLACRPLPCRTGAPRSGRSRLLGLWPFRVGGRVEEWKIARNMANSKAGRAALRVETTILLAKALRLGENLRNG